MPSDTPDLTSTLHVIFLLTGFWARACARSKGGALFDLPVGQVRIIFGSHLAEPVFEPGPESLEVRQFSWTTFYGTFYAGPYVRGTEARKIPCRRRRYVRLRIISARDNDPVIVENHSG